MRLELPELVPGQNKCRSLSLSTFCRQFVCVANRLYQLSLHVCNRAPSVLFLLPEFFYLFREKCAPISYLQSYSHHTARAVSIRSDKFRYVATKNLAVRLFLLLAVF